MAKTRRNDPRSMIEDRELPNKTKRKRGHQKSQRKSDQMDLSSDKGSIFETILNNKVTYSNPVDPRIKPPSVPTPSTTATENFEERVSQSSGNLAPIRRDRKQSSSTGGEKIEVVQDPATLDLVRSKVQRGQIEMFIERDQFKHIQVKIYLDQFMPKNRKVKTFKTFYELEEKIVQECNKIHYGQAVISDATKPRYLLAFTTNYCQLKCSACTGGK